MDSRASLLRVPASLQPGRLDIQPLLARHNLVPGVTQQTLVKPISMIRVIQPLRQRTCPVQNAGGIRMWEEDEVQRLKSHAC